MGCSPVSLPQRRAPLSRLDDRRAVTIGLGVDAWGRAGEQGRLLSAKALFRVGLFGSLFYSRVVLWVYPKVKSLNDIDLIFNSCLLSSQ